MFFISGTCFWRDGSFRRSQNQIRECNWFRCVSSGILSGSRRDSVKRRELLGTLSITWLAHESLCRGSQSLSKLKTRLSCLQQPKEGNDSRLNAMACGSALPACLWTVGAWFPVWVQMVKQKLDGAESGNAEAGQHPPLPRPCFGFILPVSSRKCSIKSWNDQEFSVRSRVMARWRLLSEPDATHFGPRCSPLTHPGLTGRRHFYNFSAW